MPSLPAIGVKFKPDRDYYIIEYLPQLTLISKDKESSHLLSPAPSYAEVVRNELRWGPPFHYS